LSIPTTLSVFDSLMQTFASPDISGVTLDSEAMVRLWRGAKEILNSVPFSEEPTSGHHHYFKNDFYSFGDAISST
jgi:hypothetical protein